MHSTSPYLRQHAHNPVYWYPWGKEALERARSENKPILLSIGYSTCYWCHVMEREVFENLSIASQMNRNFINIKIDREEYPQLDEIYMVARQIITRQGGWPNNVFLTPELKPFYAGGTFGAKEGAGRPSFPQILEWLHALWTTDKEDVRAKADELAQAMHPYLSFTPASPEPGDSRQMAGELYAQLRRHRDEKSGGFFQAPKFPHECFLSFLLSYHEHTGSEEALAQASHSLSAMATGGLYDHVGCGFHRYAIDKDWLVPHFEKMLYNQAQMVRIYTDAARITGNAYFADIARSVLDFSCGPLLDASGGFYAGIDAETDGIEGAYYAWTGEQLAEALSEEEQRFLTQFYTLADIPAFPGHKHCEGQVLVAKRPLDEAARMHNAPYIALAAQTGQVMNKLLHLRNQRPSPRLDDKIITAWNGLMIDALAHAGEVFADKAYLSRARNCADFLLEKAIDNNGKLHRITIGGKPQLDATLEDYAFLAKGLLRLHRAVPDESLLASAMSLMEQAQERFGDPAGGYYFMEDSPDWLVRIKSVEDSAIPNANAVMLDNLAELYLLTGQESWQVKATALRNIFINAGMRVFVECASMVQAALKLDALLEGAELAAPQAFAALEPISPPMPRTQVAEASVALFPADAAPGDACEAIITLDIAEGWYIHSDKPQQDFLIATQLGVRAPGVQLAGVVFPQPNRKTGPDGTSLSVFEGRVHITVRLIISQELPARPPIELLLCFQPCSEQGCHKPRDLHLSV